MKKIVRAVKKLMRPRPKKMDGARHGIAPAAIDAEAAAAVARLQKAGYETYIVGGAVRDLMLGIAPKDFDLSTSATPPEVKKLFRRARIIGRRFKIVHLPLPSRGRFAVMEVTTFRADGEEVVRNASGRILTDNLFGTPAQDAVRRDFTCNALFYNPADGKITDYAGGCEDIRRRRLRVIGAPTERFRQDPVRMLRALRLEAKLGLILDKSARRAVCANAALLSDIASSRLFDEAVKIINSGAAAAAFRACAECGVGQYVLPAACKTGFAETVLQNADNRRNAGEEISLSFTLAGVFWPPVAARWRELRDKGAPPVRAMETAAKEAEFSENPTVPRRVAGKIMDLYFLQARFEARMTLRRATGILRHPLFSRAIAFTAMREDEGAAQTAEWWRAYQNASGEHRKKMITARA